MKPLIDALRARNVILFVGAGVSKNVGAPTWSELIGHVAELVDFDPAIFRGLGDSLTLAEYFQIQKGSLGPLRSWMDVQWHSHEKKLAVVESELFKLLVNLPLNIIYTTNYDRYLEWACETHGVSFRKILNVGSLVQLNGSERQIVKFHGDFDDDESLVLTESSYFDRLSFESPLDIKLRSDVLGKTILFVGYSLSDINIRYLLYKLHLLWQTSLHSKVQPSSYMFLSRPNTVQEQVLASRGITPIVSEVDDPGEGLLNFLKKLHAQLS